MCWVLYVVSHKGDKTGGWVDEGGTGVVVMLTCVCVCVCVRERRRQRGGVCGMSCGMWGAKKSWMGKRGEGVNGRVIQLGDFTCCLYTYVISHKNIIFM